MSTTVRTVGGGARAVPETAPADWPARARAVAPLVAAASGRIEAERRVPGDVMAALHEAELFRMTLPRALGGGEAPPRTVIEVMETIAAVDASTAWCLGQAAGCAFSAAYLDRDSAREVFGAPDSVLAWGPAIPGVRASAVEGGYRVTGRFPFASGVRNATWLGAHCPVFEADGTPRRDAGGAAVVKTLLFPIERATIEDVWHVIGLRGTGSDTYEVADLFVPERLGYVRDKPEHLRDPAPLYRIRTFYLYAMAFSGVALGIARASLDALVGLATEKKALHMATVLRENARIQTEVAVNEGKLSAARAFLMEMADETWATACSGEDFPDMQRARLRIATTFAARQASEVVSFAYNAAGSTAIFEANPFERRLRDMNAVTQQAQAQVVNLEYAGRVLLGLPPGPRV